MGEVKYGSFFAFHFRVCLVVLACLFFKLSLYSICLALGEMFISIFAGLALNLYINLKELTFL